MTTLGREQALSPEFSGLQALYIKLLGFPTIGLQMRGRRILPVVEREVRRARERHARSITICDAGCGRGTFSFALAASFPDCQIVGLEYERALVEQCRAIAERLGCPNCTFRQWDITRPLEGGPWDVVLNIETLEHVEAHEKAVSNLYEATRPGGVLICHVPSYHSRMFGAARPNIDVPGHVRLGYHGPDLVDMLRSTGFEVDRWESTYGSLETLCQRTSYAITGAAMRNASLYALVYPQLRLLACLGGCFSPGQTGTNVLAVARRPGPS